MEEKDKKIITREKENTGHKTIKERKRDKKKEYKNTSQ